MAVITLTTDWQKSDYYIGAVKGKIISRDQSINIVDISHQVSLFNVMQAAFVLRNCYHEFPEGTIHIIGVNAALSQKRSLLIIEQNNHFFICSDSGFPGLIFPEEDPRVYEVKVEEEKGNTFASLDVFVDVAHRLAQGESPESFAQPSDEYFKQIPFLPTIDNKLINGSVIYVDSFSNAITNINRETFEKVGQGKPFEISIQSNHYKIDNLNKTYSESAAGDLLALFNSSGLLEIAIHNGMAAELLNLNINSAIRIRFFEKPEEEVLKLSGG